MTRATISPSPLQPSVAAPATPPLQNGDRLTRTEFERRYEKMPHLKKAELIEGIVYTPPPAVSIDYHADPHFTLVSWFGHYRFATPGLRGADNASIRLDLDNMPQPDVLLLIQPQCGGKTRMSADGYVEGAPELAAEIAASSASYDLHAKLRVYRRNGVREYIVWRVYDGQIDWFILRDGEYQPLPRPDGICRSEVFPGLWLDPAALMAEDFARLIQVLQQGLASPEHAAFVTRLQQAAAPKS